MDIYFEKKYGELYEDVEKGTSCYFEFETENGKIIHQFIKRLIPYSIDNSEYYDIVTPYGYGGPIIEYCKDKEKLLNEFNKAFSQYCEDNNIVAEFVRFHPIYNNQKDFASIYNISFNRHTLATNVRDYENPYESEFSSSCRKTIRQVLKKGISFKMIEEPSWDDMKEFMRIYYLNMERKEADDYYFFDEKYFKKIYDEFYGKFVIAQSLFEGKVVASGLYFISDGNVHAHLSGTDTEFLYLSPAYILKYGTVLWAKDNNYNFIHYGGGTSSSEDNPLYIFKCKFAQNTKLDFYIGKKIWNSNMYTELCKLRNVSESEEFFPAYRKEI